MAVTPIVYIVTFLHTAVFHDYGMIMGERVKDLPSDEPQTLVEWLDLAFGMGTCTYKVPFDLTAGGREGYV